VFCARCSTVSRMTLWGPRTRFGGPPRSGAPRTPSYKPKKSWNGSGEDTGIGKWVRENMNGVPDGDAEEAVLYAVGHLALWQLDATKAVAAGDSQPRRPAGGYGGT
jgi:hypothetical protein